MFLKTYKTKLKNLFIELIQHVTFIHFHTFLFGPSVILFLEYLIAFVQTGGKLFNYEA